MSDTVIQLAEQFKTALAKQDLAAERRLITTYRGLWATIREKADALILEIGTLENATPAQVQRLKRYGALMEDIRQELGRFGTYARVEMTTAAREAIRMGEGNARILTAAQLGNAQLASQLNRLNPEAIERLLGFLSSDGALFKRLDKLSGWTAQQVADAILEGVALGKGPRATARLLSKTLMDGVTQHMGMALTDSLRMMRTVQLYSYREANRASYIANDDVVKGWIWFADVAKACPACMAMHGTEHPLTERLDDHHNGGCAELPLVIGEKNDIPSGESVFRELSEAEQKQRMGPEKWQAWQDGKFDFSQLSTTHTDDVYGEMRSVTSLKDLIGSD